MKRFIYRWIALALSCLLLQTGWTVLAAPPEEHAVSSHEWEVLQLLNEARADAGLAPLSVFDSLQSAARVRANELHQSFSHTRPDGQSCFTALQEAQIAYRTAGENIALGYTSPAAVVQAWMASEGHRENILNASFAHVGVGQDKNADANLFVGGCAAQRVTLSAQAVTLPLGTDLADAGVTVTVRCAAHGDSSLPLQDSICRGFDPKQAGLQTVTVWMGEASTELTVTVQDGSTAPRFSDVTAQDWFYAGVNTAVRHGWMQGVSAEHFAPSQPLTRAMAVTVLGRMQGIDPAAYAPAFADTPVGGWYTPYAAWAKEAGISNGTGDGRFAPDSILTREQFCVMLSRLQGADGADVTALDRFSDAGTISPWAREACAFAVAQGWLTGRPDGSLAPRGALTRAEAAVLLARIFA